jgi:hypothetical protein
MKTFNANVITELNKSELALYATLQIDFSTPIYRTDCDIPLVIGDGASPETLNRYLTTNPFTVEAVSHGSDLTPSVLAVTIENVDVEMSAIVLNEQVIGDTVTLGLVVLDSDHVIIDNETVFIGFIDTYTLDENAFAIQVVNELALWNKRTLRRHTVDCSWVFKGTECGYSGSETWCDQSYTRCTALANTDAYGGFRHLSSIVEKEVFWGRK